MSFNMSSETLEIACPNCNKKIKEKIAWFKGKRQCPYGCGIVLDCDELARGFKNAENSINKLSRNIRDMFR